MTYKELVNNVLTRLREDTVASVSETDYSRLVGAFVNDAKRVVEDAWPWRSLRRTVEVPITGGSSTTYDLEDYTTVEDSAYLNSRASLFYEPETSRPVMGITTAGKERDICLQTFSDQYITNVSAQNANSQSPLYAIKLTVNPNPVAGRTDMRIQPVPNIPKDTETLRIVVVNPKNDLTSDGEQLTVPEMPVLQLAYLYCLYERGEELGELLSLTSMKAEAALGDAISRDSQDTSQVSLQVY